MFLSEAFWLRTLRLTIYIMQEKAEILEPPGAWCHTSEAPKPGQPLAQLHQIRGAEARERSSAYGA